METNGIKFGFGVVQSGQRKAAYDPELVALSTHGQFRITPQVSKALGIANGDYVMFVNNHDAIAAAFNAGQLPQFETLEAAIAEFGQWAIAKGVKAYSDKGVALTVTQRMTKDEKVAVIGANFEAALSAAMSSNDSELVDALSAEGLTDEEKVEILAANYSAEVDKYLGSKCANASDMIGTGVVLNFTDSNIWNILKAGLRKEDKVTTVRTYPIDLAELTTVEVYNGYENVAVPALPLSREFVDSKVTPRGQKESE